MEENYFVTDQAKCICKYGSSPGQLKVISHQLMIINHSDKKIATSLDLGNPFYIPFFVKCSIFPSRPCSPNVVKWDNTYEGMRVSRGNPLLPGSIATCAVAGTPCIQIVHHGQIELLGPPHVKNATAEFQSDLDPTGSLCEEDRFKVTATLF